MIAVKILVVMLMGVINAFFSYFLDYCFYDNSIFKNYLPYLSKNLVRLKKPGQYKLINKAPIESRQEEIYHQANSIFLFKILGGCIICTNIWIGMISYVGIEYKLHFGIWYALPYILTASFLLRKITKTE